MIASRSHHHHASLFFHFPRFRIELIKQNKKERRRVCMLAAARGDFEIADDASVRNSHSVFFPHVILDVRG